MCVCGMHECVCVCVSMRAWRGVACRQAAWRVAKQRGVSPSSVTSRSVRACAGELLKQSMCKYERE